MKILVSQRETVVAGYAPLIGTTDQICIEGRWYSVPHRIQAPQRLSTSGVDLHSGAREGCWIGIRWYYYHHRATSTPGVITPQDTTLSD
jgi:hypothetical protein